MNTRFILCGLFVLSFHGAPAQEFLGAEKALERIATETAAGKGENKKDDPNEAWLARAEEFAKAAPTLPAKDAAARWLALADEWRALPPDPSAAFGGEFGQRGVLALMKALPSPAAWDALDDAVSARPREGDDAPFNLGLKLLTGGLRGEFQKVNVTAKYLAAAGGKSRRGQMSFGSLRNVTEWIEKHHGEPRAAVARFEESLKKYESGIEQGMIEVPDLVTLVGAAKAEAFLKRALLAGNVQLRIEIGDATRALAVKTATSLVPKFKVSHWELIGGSSPAEIALYEALAKKFPRKDKDANADTDASEGGGDRDSAEVYYVVGLIQAKRTAEAAKLALARAARGGDYALFGETVESMIRGASVQPMRAFLRELLSKNPALPFWPDFISLSAKASESADALAFLRKTAARENLPADAKEHIRQHLWSALLAADEVDEGVKLLRETLDAKLAKIEANPAAAKKEINRRRYSGSTSDDPGELALRLARIGRLLEKPELVDAGIKAARALIAASAKDIADTSSLPSQLATLMSDLGRGAEAEAVLVDELIASGKRQALNPNPYADDTALLGTLAGVYHRADRHEDVLALLATAKGWRAGDLAGISTYYFGESMPPSYLTASALTATARKDEARKIILDLLMDRPGLDPAYELLLQLGGDDLIATLDALFANDRFEERPLIWKAKLQLDAGRFDEAEKTVRAAIAIDPSDGEQGKGTRMRAYAVLGDILEKKGDTAQAKMMRGAVEAIRLSENADDWWQAGLLTRAAKMYEEALGHFADAYCIQSRLALRYAELGNFAKAEEHYRRAFELMPDSFGRIESHCFGCEHAFNGERAQNIAEKVFTSLAEKTPGKPQVFYLLGYLREEQDRHAEAAESYRKAVSLDPDYFNAWSKLAGLSGSFALPPADREAAALNMLRLDPLGRHRSGFYGSSPGNSDSTISEITDFRVLWKILEDAAKLAPARAAEIFPLPAAKAELERRKKAEAGNPVFMRPPSSPYGDENGRRNNTAHSPGAMLVRHEFIASIARLLQEMVQSDDAY